VAALADALYPSVPSLVAVVDQRVIRSMPGAFSRSAIEAVGKGDKPLLVAVTVGLVVALGVGLGPVVGERRWLGPAAFVAVGGLAVACAASLDGVPVVGTALAAGIAVISGAIALQLLLSALAADAIPAPEPPVDSAALAKDFLASWFVYLAWSVEEAMMKPTSETPEP